MRGFLAYHPLFVLGLANWHRSALCTNEQICVIVIDQRHSGSLFACGKNVLSMRLLVQRIDFCRLFTGG